MPYQAKQGPRYYKKYQKYKSRKGQFTYGQVVDKVIKDVKVLKGLINVEFKTLDTAVSAAVTTTPSIALINAPPVGDDFDERDGRQVRFKSCQLSVTMYQHASATQTAIRIMIVIDKQPNETLIEIGDLINATTTVSFRNLDQRKRFVILHNSVHVLSITGEQVVHMDWYKQMDMITLYDDTTTNSIASISTNALYLVIFSTEATNGPTIWRTTRVRFIDN